MTRTSLKRTLSFVYTVLGLLLLVALAMKLFARGNPLDLPPSQWAATIYEFVREMAPLFIAVLATLLASAFQKRAKFTGNLEQEWRGIVTTKSKLINYCEMQSPTSEAYAEAYSRISEALDNMRIVYRNVGETDTLIGLYPYAPLHDMRRVLMTLDPRTNKNVTPEYRRLVGAAIMQSFNALRENFLEELDIEEPVHPLLIYGGRRLKVPGQDEAAKRRRDQQRKRQDDNDKPRPGSLREEIDDLVTRLALAEDEKDRATSGEIQPASTATNG